MEYRAATWRTRRLAAEPCPLWSIGPFAINVLPLKAQVKDRVTRSPTPHHPLKFEITFCVRGVISPLLSNLYLNEVDRMLEKAVNTTRRGKSTNVQYARFADDMVILIDAERRSDWLVKAIDKRLREEFAKLRVEINEDKSRMVDLKKGESFTFLGFEYRRVLSLQRKWRPYYAPKLKKRTALYEKLREVFRQHVSWPVETVIAKINPILRGWVNYFRVGHSSICFGVVKRWVEEKVRRHLMRARGRKGFGWTRWSSEWLYDRLGLFNNYQLVRWSGAKVAPAR
jgi:RNA-directed DNA polymerase